MGGLNYARNVTRRRMQSAMTAKADAEWRANERTVEPCPNDRVGCERQRQKLAAGEDDRVTFWAICSDCMSYADQVRVYQSPVGAEGFPGFVRPANDDDAPMAWWVRRYSDDAYLGPFWSRDEAEAKRSDLKPEGTR